MEILKMINEEQRQRDSELVRLTREGWGNFKDYGETTVASVIVENPEYFSDKLGERPLFNLGSDQIYIAEVYTGALEYEGISGKQCSPIPNGASKVVLVDPFPKRSIFGRKIEENEEIRLEEENMCPMYESKNIFFKNTDALSFLNQQEDNSGNVLTSNLDWCVLPSESYVQRVAEEVYRVVPKGGILIASYSPGIEEFAEGLFPRVRRFHGIGVYEK